MNERQILRRLDEISAESKTLRKELEALRKDKSIKCAWCDKRTKLSKLTLIQTHWYVKPYGCTGGDYWKRGEKVYDCPKCGKRNRGLDKNWPGCTSKIEKLAPYFGAQKDEHDD